MFRPQDPYSFFTTKDLYRQNKKIGYLQIKYMVNIYDDVKLSNSDSSKRKFLVTCEQKINISNSPTLDPLNDSQFIDYPALLTLFAFIDNANSNLDIKLIEYFPQTINTKVQASSSSNDSSGNTSGSSQSSTVGSSVSQTNTYGISASAGPSEFSNSISAHVENSITHTNEHSATNSRESSSSNSHDSSNSSSMSIKDWGAYGYVNTDKIAPFWTFGQEFPWDVIECRLIDHSNSIKNQDRQKRRNLLKIEDSKQNLEVQEVKLLIPIAMRSRLYDGVCLYPPSHLSMFGFNFVTKSSWIVSSQIPDDTLTFIHIASLCNASHKLEGKEVNVYRDNTPIDLSFDKDDPSKTKIQIPIDVTLMSLDAIGVNNKGGVVGFIPRKFIIKPNSSENKAFKIISNSNDLLIKDITNYSEKKMNATEGFSASETSLTLSFNENVSEYQFIMYFKVLDSIDDYTLFLKSWKSNINGVVLTIIINGDEENALIKYIDSEEAEGGENNLTTIFLRNLDYSSVNYHDYLQLGLNSIQINVRPIKPEDPQSCIFNIRAVSIEKN